MRFLLHLDERHAQSPAEQLTAGEGRLHAASELRDYFAGRPARMIGGMLKSATGGGLVNALVGGKSPAWPLIVESLNSTV